jgi:flagellar protein FliS
LKNVADAYLGNDLKCRVLSASPHELICMLFDGILVSLGRARYLLEHGDRTTASNEIGRAVNILNEGLIGSLEGIGKDPLANDLHEVYVFCVKQLLSARISGDCQVIQRVDETLGPIAQAWREIGTNAPEKAAATA